MTILSLFIKHYINDARHFRYLFRIISIPTLKRSGRFGRIPQIGFGLSNPLSWRKRSLENYLFINILVGWSISLNQTDRKIWRWILTKSWRYQSSWSALLNALFAFQASNRPTSPQERQYESHYIHYNGWFWDLLPQNTLHSKNSRNKKHCKYSLLKIFFV